MALTVTSLASAMRLGDGVAAPTEPLTGILTRLLGAVVAHVELVAPDAPADIKDEAAIRFASYLYDAAPASSGGGYAAAWRNSGAESLTSRWVVRRAIGAG